MFGEFDDDTVRVELVQRRQKLPTLDRLGTGVHREVAVVRKPVSITERFAHGGTFKFDAASHAVRLAKPDVWWTVRFGLETRERFDADECTRAQVDQRLEDHRELVPREDALDTL